MRLIRLASLAVLVAIVCGAGLGWSRFAALDLAGPPCPRTTAAAAAATRFGSGDVVGRSRVNGARVRAASGEPQPRCVQVLNRAECVLVGPVRVRAEAGSALRHVSLPHGAVADLHLRPGEIRCAVRERRAP